MSPALLSKPVRATHPALCLFFLTSAIWAQQSFVPTVIGTPGAPSSVLFGVYGNSPVISADLGKTWKPVYITQAGLAQPPVNAFVIDPLNSNTWYIGTTIAAGAFWKSTDEGQTWTQASVGLPTTGTGVSYLKVFVDTITYLYARVGGNLYKSSNGAKTWTLQSVLPGSSGGFAIADSFRGEMYYVDPATLTVYLTLTEGVQWQPVSTILPSPPSQAASVLGLDIPYFDASDIYVAVSFPQSGATAYSSLDGAAFADQSGAGLLPFAEILSASTGPTYALEANPNQPFSSSNNPDTGFLRSTDSGKTWQNLGASGLEHYAMTTADPGVRTTIYGVETVFPSPTPSALVQSLDSGNTWTAIPATITPSIGKPVPVFNITVEQGAPYFTTFSIQTAESPVWQTPVTLSTSGEPWIQIGATSGTTPLANSITISSAGLLPGTYTSTITISASQTFNKVVNVPVQLTVRPLGSLGPGYLITTAAGNGNPAGSATSGAPGNVAIGDAKALGIDASGNVLISAGSRIWELSNATQPGATLTALAGTGVKGSNGDGANPLTAQISDPDAIAFDASGAAYFTEFAPERVRKLIYAQSPGNANIGTALDMTVTQVTQPVGSHSVVLNPSAYMYLTAPGGVLHFDGARVSLSIPESGFSNPYAMMQDSSGNFYVSDMGRNQILEVSPAGVVTVFAGNGIAGFGGDGGAATQAMLSAPAGIAFDSQGTMYIADSGNNRIRTVTPDGVMHTIAGSGLAGFAGDNSTSDFAEFQAPLGVAVDAGGNVYVADTGNNRVRILKPSTSPTPQIRTIQGPNRATQLAPGGLFSLYGAQLATPGYLFMVTAPMWPRSAPPNASGAGAVSITINGVAAPLYYVSPTQINGQIPYETALGTATAAIAVDGSLAAQVNFSVVAAAPDVLVQDGGMQALAINLAEGNTVNSPASPAHPGDMEMLFLSGIGLSNPPLITGESAPSSPPYAEVNYPYQITLNGQMVSVGFLGYAPNSTALVQSNITIPKNLTGDLTLIVTVNGQSSVPTTISVR